MTLVTGFCRAMTLEDWASGGTLIPVASNGHPAFATLGYAMNPFSVTTPHCAGSTSHADCGSRTAVDVALGPPASSEIMCGLGVQEMFARTAIQPKDGQYNKITCAAAGLSRRIEQPGG